MCSAYDNYSSKVKFTVAAPVPAVKLVFTYVSRAIADSCMSSFIHREPFRFFMPTSQFFFDVKKLLWVEESPRAPVLADTSETNEKGEFSMTTTGFQRNYRSQWNELSLNR